MPLPTYKLPPLVPSTKVSKKPPVDIFHAQACANIGQTFEFIDSMDLTTKKKATIKTQLHWSILQAFGGRLHSARNGLVLASDQLAASQGIQLIRVKPDDIPAVSLKKRTFHHKASNTDLWDTLRLPRKEHAKRRIDDRYLAKVLMVGAAKKDPLVAKSLDLLSGAAVSLQVLDITCNRVETAFECWDILMDNWMQLPTNWRSVVVPGDLWARIVNAFPDGQSVYYEGKKIGVIWEGIATHSLVALSNARSALDAGDVAGLNLAQSKLAYAEALMLVWQLIIEYIQEQETAAKETEVKQIIRDNDIWDIIADCLYGQFRDRFIESLDDWYGTKKYIVLAGCGGPALLMIYTSSGAMLLFAIETFIACFICHMLYGLTINPTECAQEAAKQVVTCLFSD